MQKKAFIFSSIFLFFFHSSNTLIVTFLPLYFQGEHLSSSQIGWLMAAGPFASLFSQPYFGYMSDKYKTIKKVLLVCLAGVFIVSFFLFQVHSFWLLLGLAAILFALTGSVVGLGDSLALNTAHSVGGSFGSIRMWGSVGFAVTSVIGGQVLTQIGIQYLMYPYLIYVFITLFFCLKLLDISVPSDPINVKEAVKIVSQPRFLLFLLFVMFIAITHRTNDIYQGIFIKSIGGNESLIGLSWFLGVAVEAIVFLLSPIWLRYFNENIFMVLAAGLYGVRWMLISIASTPMQVVLLHSMHGLTFGVFYLCSFQYAAKFFPPKYRSTGQLVFTSVFFGLCGIIGSIGGGVIIDHFNGASLYRILSYFAVAGGIGLILFNSKNRLILKTSGNN